MQRRKAIGDKLKRVKSYGAQKECLLEWAENWKADQLDVIGKLKIAIRRNDYHMTQQMLAQLDGMTEKRFTGLKNVFATVSSPERKLTDNADQPHI